MAARSKASAPGRLETACLTEALRALVEAENQRLEADWRQALRRLVESHGPWAAHLLAGRPAPRLTRLTLAVPCYAPKADQDGSIPEVVRLGRPGFWRRLVRRDHPWSLLLEITADGTRLQARAVLEERREEEKAGEPEAEVE